MSRDEDDYPRPSPGELRRNDLVRAGMDVLLEQGWSAMTARTVAERAGTRPGSIHYHFGSFAGLLRQVTAALVVGLFDDAVDVMTQEPGWREGLAAVIRTRAEVRERPGVPVAATDRELSARYDDVLDVRDDAVSSGRFTADLVVASLQDAAVRFQVVEVLADTRERLLPWLERTGVPAEHAEGTAALLLAALDGLLLHGLADSELDLGQVEAATRRL